MSQTKGRVTIPTNLDVVPETIELMKRWGADAIRDCDGTEFPEELTKTGAKIYATYYTTRKDNEWAKANPDEVQQCYVMTAFYTAVDVYKRQVIIRSSRTEKQIFKEEFIMRKKLTAVLPAAAMFAYALAGTTGIAQNVYAADEEETLSLIHILFMR